MAFFEMQKCYMYGQWCGSRQPGMTCSPCCRDRNQSNGPRYPDHYCDKQRDSRRHQTKSSRNYSRSKMPARCFSCHSETFCNPNDNKNSCDSRGVSCYYNKSRSNSTTNSCSSKESLHHNSANCCCGQPEPINCTNNYNIDRLVSMVRKPMKTKYSTALKPYDPCIQSTARNRILSYRHDYEEEEEEDDDDDDTDDEFCESCRDVEARTRLMLMPPRSCFVWCKKSENNNGIKHDRETQCRFDLDSDFCTCSKSVCEYCSKKICCSCTKIRCCLCGKLKTSADRKVFKLDICKCPRRTHCFEILKSYLRFNSSPALWRDHVCGSHEIIQDQESTSFRPYTY